MTDYKKPVPELLEALGYSGSLGLTACNDIRHRCDDIAHILIPHVSRDVQWEILETLMGLLLGNAEQVRLFAQKIQAATTPESREAYRRFIEARDLFASAALPAKGVS